MDLILEDDLSLAKLAAATMMRGKRPIRRLNRYRPVRNQLKAKQKNPIRIRMVVYNFWEEGMDFLGIGLGEILLILVVAFLVWGPARIIEVGRSLGKAIHAFKQAAGELTLQVSKELEEQKKELPQGKQVKD